MIWKMIGQSVIGTSHIQSGKTCEDAVYHKIMYSDKHDEVLLCFVSDGAGSAKYAAKAADASVLKGAEFVEKVIYSEDQLTESNLIAVAEQIYDHLTTLAAEQQVPKNEFSCTLLGCIIFPDRAGFIQIGDGAIVRSVAGQHLTTVWWPHNGEYQNTTTFLIDDPNFPHLKTKVIDETITEIGIFTDGLQMLTLNNETEGVHQPFFNNLFPLLRRATEPDHLAILNNRLIEYLSGDVINNRTDDDKTLFLATRL